VHGTLTPWAKHQLSERELHGKEKVRKEEKENCRAQDRSAKTTREDRGDQGGTAG
jgi:hypothetical protein